MTIDCPDSVHAGTSAMRLVTRASQGWDRCLNEFFEPILGWIVETREDPRQDPGAGESGA